MPQNDVELILMRQLATYLSMPIFMVGSDENLLFYNEAAERLLGRQYVEAGEMPLEELPSLFKITTLDGSPLPPNEFPLFVALREHRPAHLPVRYHALDGVWREVAITAFPLEGQGGRHLGAVAIFWEANH
jgi:PAS domain-containing protein